MVPLAFGTRLFLPSLLTHVRRSAAPGFPVEPVLIQVLLIAIVSGDRNLILRVRDEDVPLVSKLVTLALTTVFGYNTHRLKCHPHQSPSEFLRALFFATVRHRRVSTSRNSAHKSPSTSIGTARPSSSHPIESKPSIATLACTQSDADSKPSTTYLQRSTQTDSTVKAHVRHTSHASTDPHKLPSVVVVSNLELTSLPCQKALLRTLAERKIALSDGGIVGHDKHASAFDLPDGFFIVYVCRSDPRERPPIYNCLLDRFAMSSSVDVSAQTRLAMRQFRPPSSPSTTLSSLHTAVPSASFPTLHPSPGPPTPVEILASPLIPPTLLQQLKYLCATQTHMRPPLNIYLADLFSATRHYGPLDSMMLTARARQDAEALARASRVLGTDRTGADFIKDLGSRETDSTPPPSIASTSSDALVDGLDGPETHESFGSAHPFVEQLTLDVSEADIARMFPRAVSHRIRVRDSPFDEILSSAVCGAIRTPGNEPHEVQWERETVKDILVHILSQV